AADAVAAHGDLHAGGRGGTGRTGRRAGRSAGGDAEPGARHRRPLDVLAGDAAVRRGDAPASHRVRPALRAAPSVRHGAAAVDPHAARSWPLAVPARLDGPDGADHADAPGSATQRYAARSVR